MGRYECGVYVYDEHEVAAFAQIAPMVGWPDAAVDVITKLCGTARYHAQRADDAVASVREVSDVLHPQPQEGDDLDPANVDDVRRWYHLRLPERVGGYYVRINSAWKAEAERRFRLNPDDHRARMLAALADLPDNVPLHIDHHAMQTRCGPDCVFYREATLVRDDG